VLAEMRAADPPVSYLVGTPKGRLAKLEKALVTLAHSRDGDQSFQTMVITNSRRW
jgi:hypothetical protein